MTAKEKKGKHKKPMFKSFDSSIMELADDIAYGVHDLEDAIALRLVSEGQWRTEVVSKIKDTLNPSPLSKNIDRLTGLLFSGKNKIRKKAIGELVNHFIINTKVISQNEFTHKLLDFQAIMDDAVRDNLDILQEFVMTNVIFTPEVQTLEYKGQQMIVKLFDVIANNPKRLLPTKYYKKYELEGNNLRVISDYLVGTTDDYATRLYHKIFTPSSGSIFDRL